MLQVLLLTFSVVTIAHAELCKPDAQNAFKVRLSIKTALGDNAYAWDTNEEYLFKAMVAFTMRRYSSKTTTQMNRNRINNAFLLSDKTLQFLKIPSTLAPPVEPSTPAWLIVFGVVLCLIVAGIVFLVVAGIQQRKKKNKESTERENLEEKGEVTITIENGTPCETLDLKAGHINGVFSADDERFTSL
ncbi:collectrin isoform X3 [Anas acuta]|uniref:collectrin isoform X3 n=1 Tax=Anas platyrhynchos TaxID=8839 RepID=UPI0018D6272E|nr:collectrin isoform X3 [Anas platyrhynchos]